MDITLFQSYNEFAMIALCVAAAYLGLIYLTKLLAALAMRFREKHSTISSPAEMLQQRLMLVFL